MSQEQITAERLKEIEELTRRDTSGAMHGGCTDYFCDCHEALPELLGEVKRLRAISDKLLAALKLIDVTDRETVYVLGKDAVDAIRVALADVSPS